MMADKQLTAKRTPHINHSVGGGPYLSDNFEAPPLPSEPPPIDDDLPSSGAGYNRSGIPIHNGNSARPKSAKSPSNNTSPKRTGGTPKFPTSLNYYTSGPGKLHAGDRVASPPGNSISLVGSLPNQASGYAGIYGRPGVTASTLAHEQLSTVPNANTNWGGSGTEHVYAVPAKAASHKSPGHPSAPLPVATPSVVTAYGEPAPACTLSPPHTRHDPPSIATSTHLLKPPTNSSSTLSSTTSSSTSLSSVIHVPDASRHLHIPPPAVDTRPPSGISPERAARPKLLVKVPESPSNEELISPGSCSVSSLGMPSSQPSTPQLERAARQTLGDIIQQIESKFKFLLRKTDFTGSDTIPELQFISQQSRYSSDIHIKRRLIGKLVENGLVDLFQRVFASVHKVDYLGGGVEEAGELHDTVTNGSVHGSAEGLLEAGDEEKDSSVGEDNSSLHDHRHGPSTDAMRNLRHAVTCLLNSTDKSPQLCDQCSKRGVAQMLLRELEDHRLAVSELKEANRLFLVKSYLGILNNIIRYHDKSREAYREAGAVRLLQPYLKSSLLLVKTKAIMLMSYVLNEAENDLVFAGSDRSIGFLIKMLQSAMDASNHYSKKYGHWAVEIAASLNRLGACESNKGSVVDRGALSLYARLVERGCSEEEQLVAALGLWTFAFHDANRRAICNEPRCLAGVELLGRESQREEIRRAARGAVWLANGHLPSPRPAYLTKHRGQDGPVVISFQWSSRNVVGKLKDKLRHAGYNVVTYTDSSGGAAVEKMSENLERACVVLVAVSHKYHDSPSARTELEVACRLGCDLIMLRVQPRYTPDGWLANIMQSKLSFDFTHDANMEAMSANLIRELGSRGRCKGTENDTHVPRGGPSTTSLHTVTAQVHAPPPPALNGPLASPPQGPPRDPRLLNWSTDDVGRWLRENQLAHVIERFKQMDGELLIELKKMQTVAPETFYTTLRHEMRFDLVTTLRFTRAMGSL